MAKEFRINFNIKKEAKKEKASIYEECAHVDIKNWEDFNSGFTFGIIKFREKVVRGLLKNATPTKEVLNVIWAIDACGREEIKNESRRTRQRN